MIIPRKSSLVALGLWTASLISCLAADATNMLWQIGRPNHSYTEFAIAGNYSAFAGRFDRQPLVYEVGRSDPARDWPFIQPGPADAWAAGREHPFTIRFVLPSAPRGLFTLRVDLADAHSGLPPTMKIVVSGQAGRFPLQPGGGDASLGNPSAGKPQSVELALPASLFRQGTNEISLTAVDGSWILYDAVTLFQDPQADTSQPEIRALAVEPTPLYFRQDGKLRRVLNVKVTTSAPPTDLVLTIQAGGESVEVPIKGLGGWEGFSQEVSILDSLNPIDVTITARAGAHAKSSVVTVNPGKKWKIFVGASAHTDIGYTDLQPKCAERHNENTDRALALMEKYPEFTWNLEVAWQAENYLSMRQGEQRERFLRFAKEGRLGVQALYCNLLTGLCSHEAACRMTWFAHSLQHDYGIPYRSAMISDVPTQEGSLPMLLTSAGIRYFSSGINNDRAYSFDQMQGHSPCWWEGPDCSRLLMMYAPQYAQASQWGLARDFEAARSYVPGLLKTYENRADYVADAVWLHGALGDNDLLNQKLPEVSKAWNERFEFPKVILAHNAEFFEYVERNYGQTLPVFRGSAGTYWEDGAGSSAAETTLSRKAKENLASAEQCLALARHIQPQNEYPAKELYQAWRNCFLYDEHTWGANCSISQPESEFSKQQWQIKAQFALDADHQASSLLAKGTTALSSLVKTDGRSLVILNSASWPRTDVLTVHLPEGVGVVDPDTLSCDAPEGTLLLVKNVPACGYRVLKLREKASPLTVQPAEGSTIESRFYRVSFDSVTGSVTSVFDKQLQRELVDSNAPFHLNQYLYVAGGEGSRIVMNERGPEPKLTLSVPEKAQLRRFRLGDLGERMTVETSGKMAPRILTEITVWNDLARIDIVNRLTKTQTYDKEAVYFSFPFAAEKPTFRYECPVAIVNVNTGMLPGACLDWFSVQHFVEIESQDAAIAWATPDAPLVCLQDINRGQWRRENRPMTTGHLYAYVMNNYWHTNYKPGQGGEHRFRFSISSRAKTDNAASARFGWAASNPLVAVPADNNPGALLPPGSASLVEIAEPNVLLIGTKQADSGDGLVLRLWEVSGKAATAHLRLRHLPVRVATACNLVEEPQGPLELKNDVIQVPIRGSGLVTVKIQ